jgi:hypothetical protein
VLPEAPFLDATMNPDAGLPSARQTENDAVLPADGDDKNPSESNLRPPETTPAAEDILDQRQCLLDPMSDPLDTKTTA